MARSGLQERRHADSRQDILEAAREIVNRDGPGAMTLGAVASQVGLTTPALYYYFRSKEELLQALVDAWIRAEADVIVETCETWKGPEAGVLGAIVRALYEHYRPNLSAFRLIYLRLQTPGPAGIGLDRSFLAQLHLHSKRMFGAMEAVLLRGQKAKTVSPNIHARTTCVACHAAMVGLMTMVALTAHASDPLKQTDEALVTTLCGLVVAGAAHGPAMPDEPKPGRKKRC